jgi:hypothetical protein
MSLSAGNQDNVSADDYEIIVVDNGSPTPIDPSDFADLDGHFRLIRIDDAPPSPAHAVNVGLREARGEVIGVLLDGARLVSPGIVNFALAGSRVSPRSAVVALGWYLGFDYQRHGQAAGWTQDDEDALLRSVGWPNDGYRLFEISTMDECSGGGWFEAIVESNLLFLPANTWDELGGYDERFNSPGGGLANHDMLRRATELDCCTWVVLLGEGTFHQLHGGIATNATRAEIDHAVEGWTEEYREVRGRELEPLWLPKPVYIGTLPNSLRPQYAQALNTRLHGDGALAAAPAPPVPLPRLATDPGGIAECWSELAFKAAEKGHGIEALTFARWARAAGWEAPELGPLLSCLAAEATIDLMVPARRAQFHLDVGNAYLRFGPLDKAAEHYGYALAADPGKGGAYLGLSMVRMPGLFYWEVIRKVHAELRPNTYLEIGIGDGASLALARPPTVAVAVDPEPVIRHPIGVQSHLYVERSADFFRRRDVRQIFGDRGPSLAFIDGLHEFSAALDDFLHVEAISDPDTLIMLHDMIPFDEVTQRPQRVHTFYTGDVWKLLHCLADVRPDLSWFTVRTPPSGLTFVTNLDSHSTVLRDRFDELVDRYGKLPFEDAADTPGPVIDNDWQLIAERLNQSGIPLFAATAPISTDDAVDKEFVLDSTEAGNLVRRIRELEETVSRLGDGPRVEVIAVDDSDAVAEVQFRLAQLRDARAALEREHREVESMQMTKLFRWTRASRSVYRGLRRRASSIFGKQRVEENAALRFPRDQRF